MVEVIFWDCLSSSRFVSCVNSYFRLHFNATWWTSEVPVWPPQSLGFWGQMTHEWKLFINFCLKSPWPLVYIVIMALFCIISGIWYRWTSTSTAWGSTSAAVENGHDGKWCTFVFPMKLFLCCEWQNADKTCRNLSSSFLVNCVCEPHTQFVVSFISLSPSSSCIHLDARVYWP